MTITNLYSALGYEKKTSKRKYETLDAVTHAFFREYTNQGNVISKSTVYTQEARLCALSFLHEDDRGELFWPTNTKGILEWADPEDREE